MSAERARRLEHERTLRIYREAVAHGVATLRTTDARHRVNARTINRNVRGEPLMWAERYRRLSAGAIRDAASRTGKRTGDYDADGRPILYNPYWYH